MKWEDGNKVGSFAHVYVDGDATYTWSDDNSTVTATNTCALCGHVETQTVETTSEVTTNATCTQDGSATYTATFEYPFETKTKDVTIGALGHDEEEHEAKAPTCTEAGWNAYVTCSRCDYTTKVTIQPINHAYGEVSYTWADDNTTVTAKRVCANDATHVETETVSATYAVVTAAKCEVVGLGRYTSATFANQAFAATTKDVEIPETGHTPEANWSSDETGHWNKCVNCGAKATAVVNHTSSGQATEEAAEVCTICGYEISPKLNHVDTWDESKLVAGETTHWYGCTSEGCNNKKDEAPHVYDQEEVEEKYLATPADCTNAAKYYYSCVCGAKGTETFEFGEALGHTNAAAVRENVVEATCLADGSYEEVVYCSVATCKAEISRTKNTIDKLAHNYVETVITAPNRTTPGETKYACPNGCKDSYTVVTPATGHKEETVQGKAATATATGLTDGIKCSTCGLTLESQRIIDKTFNSSNALFLEPNNNWKADGAWFAAYFFGNGDKWVAMTDTNGDGIYEVEKQEGYPNVIFCRMNPAVSALGWGGKWNQTGDLTIPTDGKNLFTVPSTAWDGSTSTWSEYTYVQPTTPIVAGSQGLCGTDFDVSNTDNSMTRDSATNAWVMTYTGVAAGSYKFKITYENSWDNAFPSSDYSFTVEADNTTVTIAYYPVAGAIHVYQATGATATPYALRSIPDNIAATCSSQGRVMYTCNCGKCSAIYVMVDRLAHDWQPVEAEDATCNAGGYIAYEECSLCGAYKEYSRVPVNTANHKYTENVTKPATCTEEGEKTFSCADCGYSYTATIPALDHKYADVCDTTCENEGCNETRVAPHSLGIYHDENAAACGEDGNIAHWECDLCHKLFSTSEPKQELTAAQVVIPARTHVDANSDCDCDYEDCDYAMHLYSSDCDTTCNREGCDGTRDSTAEHTAAERTDCTANVVCANCNAVISSGNGAHAWSDWAQVENTTQHTRSCITDGCTESQTENCTDAEDDGNHTCDVCGRQGITQCTAGNAKQENVVPATCGAAGSYDSVTYCTECNAQLSRTTETIPATGAHTGGAATCTAKAVCSVCGTSYGELAAHTEETVPGKAATCTETGLKDGKKCSVCGETLLAQEEIPATGKHEDTDNDHICNNGCGATLSECSGGTATCVAKALCEVCGKEYGEVDANNHDLVDVEASAVAATCTTAGKTAVMGCTRCDHTEGGTEIPATGHNYVDGACTVCEKVQVKLIVPTGIEAVEIGGNDILPVANAPEGYTFAGWTTVPTEVETTVFDEESIIESGIVYAGEATTLFALYTKESTEAVQVFEKVTTTQDDWTGDYLIVYEEGKVAFNGSLTKLDAASNTVAVTIANGMIDATDTLLGAVFTIDADGSAIMSASGLYIGHGSYANGLTTSATDTYTNEISIDSNGNAVIAIAIGGETITLRYNYASDQCRFRYYKSGQQAITLYKLTTTNGGTTKYYLSVCPHDYESEVTDPTCTEAGSTTFTCINCGKSYAEPGESATGHNYDTVVPTQPTCTTYGYTTRTCACGDEVVDTFVAATGHADTDANGLCDSCSTAYVAQQLAFELDKNNVNGSGYAANDGTHTENGYVYTTADIMLGSDAIQWRKETGTLTVTGTFTSIWIESTAGTYTISVDDQEDKTITGNGVVEFGQAVTGTFTIKVGDATGYATLIKFYTTEHNCASTDDYVVSETTHYQVCTTCNKQINQADHVYTNPVQSQTAADKHVETCACGAEQEVEHNFVEGTCACGAEQSTDEPDEPETPDEPTTDGEWKLVDITDIKSTDIVVITMATSDTVYALSSANGTSSAPAATTVTVENGKITSNVADTLKWNISNSNGSLTIYPNGTTDTWLYCTGTNNGVRVGTNTNKTFTIDASSGYLKHTGTSRYVGVYTTNPDFRCYTSTSTNIGGQTLAFYVYEGGSSSGEGGGTTEPETPIVHECVSPCATCGKCTNTACTETACTAKCDCPVAETKTVSMAISGTTGTKAGDSSYISWTSEDITFTNKKTSNSSAIVNTDSTYYRVYANSEVVISANGGKISKVVITITESKYVTPMKTSLENAGYTVSVSGSVVTITGVNASSIEFTASAQTRLSEIEVTYTPAAQLSRRQTKILTKKNTLGQMLRGVFMFLWAWGGSMGFVSSPICNQIIINW